MDWSNKSSNRFLSSSSWSSSPFPIISAISTSTLWNNQQLCISHTQKHERVHSFYININSCQRITFSRSSGPGAQIKIFIIWTMKETLDAMKFGAFSVFDNKNIFTRSWSKIRVLRVTTKDNISQKINYWGFVWKRSISTIYSWEKWRGKLGDG